MKSKAFRLWGWSEEDNARVAEYQESQQRFVQRWTQIFEFLTACKNTSEFVSRYVDGSKDGTTRYETWLKYKKGHVFNGVVFDDVARKVLVTYPPSKAMESLRRAYAQEYIIERDTLTLMMMQITVGRSRFAENTATPPMNSKM